jgi:putative hemolysin
MPVEPVSEPLRVASLLEEPWRGLLTPVGPAIERLLAFDRLRRLYEIARAEAGDGGAPERLLSLLGITWHIEPADLDRIPRSGPVLAVANHPFGLLEGAILAQVLPKVRPDTRILANSMLAEIPELREKCIFVDPFGRRGSTHSNATALRACLAWLRQGGLLAAFPAGEVTHVDWKNRTMADPPWNPQLARLGQRTGAQALPVFFEGFNSLTFQLAGALHPRLRTVSLPRELLNKRGRSVEARIGRPVPAAVLRSFADSRQAIEYLRCRTYLLERPAQPRRVSVRLFVRQPDRLAEAPSAVEMARQIEALPSARKLCELGDLAVFLGAAGEFPAVLREIGRLREIAFRKAGEGTGRALDLDEFDRHYLHLVLWNRKTREVAGAYRLGPTPDILPRYGIRGLYTSTLFHYQKDLFERLGPALELGRSFIRPEYQKQYAPLLMLWKGIGRYVASRPECATLFGGVSISRDYTPVSRHLLVRFLEAHRAGHLAQLLSPRRPYRPDERRLRRTGVMQRAPQDVEELSALIADLESDGKGVPILIKQYLKLGGRLLAFNVDRAFSDALDALILVDLENAPAPLLERCLGKPGAAAFAAWHAVRRSARPAAATAQLGIVKK